MPDKPELKVDFCSYQAAKYACEHWHYSGCVPKFKQVWVGVWEGVQFIGAVSFGRSSTPYLGNAFGLSTTECVELTRVALNGHINPVSLIAMEAINLLKRQSPGLRLLVSLADPRQGHTGKIYQAMNWIYIGRSSSNIQYYFRNKWRNDSPCMRYLQSHPEQRDLLPKRKVAGKFKYLYPLDKAMRRKIMKLAKPYPKELSGQSVDGNTADFQSADVGSTPADRSNKFD